MNNESYDFENRKYVNPTISRDEQLAFVDNLRNVQQNDMSKIVRDTHNLGSDLPSNEGGLTGAEGIWNAQYVDPKVNEMVAGLKSAAQAQALNDILTNHQDQWKQRYSEAYRAAEKRKEALDYAKSNSNTSGKNAGDEVDDDDPDWTDNTGGAKDVAAVAPSNQEENAGTSVIWEFDTGSGFSVPMEVKYDEYGQVSDVYAGRNGKYHGEDARIYWEKMRTSGYPAKQITKQDNEKLYNEYYNTLGGH